MLDGESLYRLQQGRVTVMEIARQFDSTATAVRERLEPFVDEQDSIPADIAVAILRLVNIESDTAKHLLATARERGTDSRRWARA